jgi:hypothetical protein
MVRPGGAVRTCKIDQLVQGFATRAPTNMMDDRVPQLTAVSVRADASNRFQQPSEMAWIRVKYRAPACAFALKQNVPVLLVASVL